ncbi:MAG: FAD-dependent oxidoreductase [Actinomycetota bacterium]
MALKMIVPPCQAACPILTDVQEYVSLAARGKFAESLEVARATNPFASVCGYICFRPCEGECRRAVVDQAVSIMAIKRAAGDYGRSQALRTKSGEKSANGQKVAVVGAGPAGLTAALDLTQLGYEVAVLEKEKQAGGMLLLAIPKYRLPREALAIDIEAIEASGVRILLGQEIGRDLSLADLKRRFDAVIVASGLPLSQNLPDFPSNWSSVQMAIPFLRAISEGIRPWIGERVVVIGGGNVAIDAARSALRLGVKKVSILYRRGRAEMPAREMEIEEAEREGVAFNYLAMVQHLKGSDGEVTGVECIRAELGEPDESGRRRPIPIAGSEFVVDADTVIVAVGQTHDPAFLGAGGQAVLEGKMDGVFLAGDVKEGPGSVVGAISSGHMVAAKVHGYLCDKVIPSEKAEALSDLTERVKEHIKKRDRIAQEVRSREDRLGDFDIYEAGFDKKDAAREALRCLSCGAGAVVNKDLCVACLTCVRVCPYKIPVIGEDGVAEIGPVECQACGICITECPAMAIDFRKDQEKSLLADVESALAISKKIEFYCQNRLFFEDGENLGDDWKRVGVRCLAHLSTATVLKAYELGAERIVIAGCPDERCSFWDGYKWARERVARAKEILREAGQSEESLTLREKIA